MQNTTTPQETNTDANFDCAWRFVEKYYPNYDHCDEIAYNDDYLKIVDKEENEGDASWETLDTWMKQDMTEEEARKFAQEQLYASNADIYQRAIEGYIESLKPTPETTEPEQPETKIEKTYYLFGSEAVNTITNESFETFLENIQEGTAKVYGTFEFIEGQTKSVELAEAFDGWLEYTIISEKEYNQINKA